MKRVAALVLLLIAGVCSAACPAAPLSREQSGNPDVTAEVIAHVNGITVYRLDVGARWIYFTDARGATSWDETRGKNQTEHFSVDTVR